MRLKFILWLVVIMFSLSKMGPMFAHGDIGGWLAQSLAFALTIFGVYYGARWVRRKVNAPKTK